MIRPLNRKAEILVSRSPDDVRPYTFGDCCPGFAPGWEVGFSGNPDPCPWQNDLPACHPCFWSGQVPDSTSFPGWLDACGNVARDWELLDVVGP